MTSFHITRGGQAAPCEASERACPLGAHFSSMEAAAMAVASTGLPTGPDSSSRSLTDGHGDHGHADGHDAPRLTPQPRVGFGKYIGRPVSDLLADQGYCRWLLRQRWFRHEHPDLYHKVITHRDVSRLCDDFNRL